MQSWSEIYHGLMSVEIDGWRLTLFNDCDTLDYCEYGRSPDSRVGTFELWQCDGVEPVGLLSAREREPLKRWLDVLQACTQKHVTIAEAIQYPEGATSPP